MNKYYIIDCGANMREYARILETRLIIEKAHYLIYLTDLPNFLGFEEVTEDMFLDQYKQSSHLSN